MTLILSVACFSPEPEQWNEWNFESFGTSQSGSQPKILTDPKMLLGLILIYNIYFIYIKCAKYLFNVPNYLKPCVPNCQTSEGNLGQSQNDTI